MGLLSLQNEFNGYSTAVIDLLPVAIIFLDPHNRLAAANQAAFDLLGRPRHDLIGRKIESFCSELGDLLERIPPGEEVRDEVVCSHHPAGMRLRIYLAPVHDARSGSTNRLMLVWRVETSPRAQPAQTGGRLPTRDLFETILESIQHGILVTDPEGLPLYINPVFLTLWEEQAAHLYESGLGWPVLLSRRLKIPERILRLANSVRAQPTAELYDFMELASGRVLECQSRPEYPVKDGPPVRIWSFEDITEQQRTERELHYLSTHDGLTGLYNRAFFELQLRQAYTYPAFPVSMIMVDVDGLKKVNDRLGHPAGDSLLISAAGVLRKACRAEDVVARLGGDEFGILLLRANNSVVEMVQERITHLVTLHGINRPDLPLSLSVGSASAVSQRELADLFSRADEDMYHKRWRKRRVHPGAHYRGRQREK